MSTSRASSKWRPSAGSAAILARANLLRSLRGFFEQANVTEVVTPVLSRAATTDPHIESFSANTSTRPIDALPGSHTGPAPWYLHTSPEFPMKRLLCAGLGDIYQVCSVFRSEESGRLHNPEFQLAEWYRCGFDHHQLMQEVENLVVRLWQALNPGAQCPSFTRLSYYQALYAATGIAKPELSVGRIQSFLERESIDCPLQAQGPAADRLDVWLDFLMSVVVAPGFDSSGFTFLYGYPASQAALARLEQTPQGEVAARFELFFGDIELANGFYELTDPAEQQGRFENDLLLRQQQGLSAVPMDDLLIEALQAGLPDCSGVALGIDRLLMVLTDTSTLDDVITFTADRA